MHISPFFSQFFLNLSQLSHRFPCVSMENIGRETLCPSAICRCLLFDQ